MSGLQISKTSQPFPMYMIVPPPSTAWDDAASHFWSYSLRGQRLDLIILADAFQLWISCDSMISSCFLLPGREIFTVMATAMCLNPEHGLSPFWIKAGVHCVVSFQQACLLTLTLPKEGSSTVAHCYPGLCNGKYSAGCLNHLVFPMIALSQKKVSRGSRKDVF